MNFSLDEEIAKALQRLASSSHRSASQWVTDRVMEAMKQEKRDVKASEHDSEKSEEGREHL